MTKRSTKAGQSAHSVFVSYSSADRDFASKLSQELKDRGINAWMADEQVTPGGNWSLETGRALERSDAMVIVLSPDAVKSEQVSRDIDYALTASRLRHRVIPVLARPTQDVPWVLRKLQMVEVGRDPKAAVRLIIDGLEADRST